ncbi:Crp/Fnr family transcriptional regulator [Actinomadura litoris]|uniref:Crp/Fnr family transcriptional regulator n=1 Tax=Actinomadura litoris TaxID=2678616 RepID=UPI001FA6F64C|nr:Crp/Fnr family transcriptional regulator [Actinomadura litoris]
MSSFWDALPDSARQRLTASGRIVSAASGRCLLYAGQPCTRVMILQTGWAKASTVTATGRTTLVDLMGSGDIIGEHEAVTGKPCLATAQLLAWSHVLSISMNRFQGIMTEDTAVTRALLTATVTKLERANHRRVLADGDAITRLGEAVRELAHRFGDPALDGVVALRVPLYGTELARYAGVSERSAARAFDALAPAIRRYGRQITIRPTLLCDLLSRSSTAGQP